KLLQSKQVRLTFDNFDIEVVQNDECSYDSVAVYESYVNSKEHGKLLGSLNSSDSVDNSCVRQLLGVTMKPAGDASYWQKSL
ncbi:hypothetical protein DICVIV_14369, partial [Dictyocaulus viviparus]